MSFFFFFFFFARDKSSGLQHDTMQCGRRFVPESPDWKTTADAKHELTRPQ
eukprot:NODE_31065_length_404_cov_4.490975.p4 GENE.NODE_31065_length_404_cov_4.490975~~NODE_31065_length_404_cov_4.490975.p4  ORF type:complete len:51 (+),score=5.64 NODE_31065_length_404_cov_4.490975:104-256(+)